MPEETITPEPSQSTADTEPTPAVSPEQPKADPLKDLLGTLDDETKLALLNEGGKKALLAEREAAKAARRDRDAALAKVQEYEREKLTEQERLAADLASAQGRAEKAIRAAVASKVEALARDFADPEDAVGSLDLTAFVDEDGAIDTVAIKDALADLLKRKPHWARPDEGGPRRPAPDRTQGSSGNGNRTPSEPAQIFAGLMEKALKGR